MSVKGKFTAARDRASAGSRLPQKIQEAPVKPVPALPVVIDELPRDVKAPAEVFAPGNQSLEKAASSSPKVDRPSKKKPLLDEDKKKKWCDTLVKIRTKRSNRLTSEWRNALDEIEAFLFNL